MGMSRLGKQRAVGFALVLLGTLLTGVWGYLVMTVGVEISMVMSVPALLSFIIGVGVIGARPPQAEVGAVSS